MFKRKAHIVFLSSSHYCVSQMAAGIANAIAADLLIAKPAVIEIAATGPNAIPNASLTAHLSAVKAMQHIGIEISDQKPMLVNEKILRWGDTVITLCEQTRQHCSVLPAGTQQTHWPLQGLDYVTGSVTKDEFAFDVIVDEIESRIKGLIGGLKMLNR